MAKKKPPRRARVRVPEGMALVALRVPVKVAHALRLAAAQRQIDGKVPNSQQDIAGAALAEWLRRNGYL
jgi:hypothetical protein